VAELITSPANPLVKRVRALADRKARRRSGSFVVEGIQPVTRAVAAGWDLDTLLVAPDLLTPPGAIRLVEQCEAAGTPVARMSGEVFAKLAERDGPTGLAAIVHERQQDLADLRLGDGSVVVALHEVDKAGNLGTIIRTADAAGAAAVLLVGDCADRFSPQAVKASMGSLFAVPVVAVPDIAELLDWAVERHVTVVAATGTAAADLWSVDYPTPLALLLGSEGRGLPDEVIRHIDRQVRIPMTGTAESLNLATAAALVLYQARRPFL
jgi:TrmH family RNA methyltransferase